MAAYAPDESVWTLESMVHEMPNPISRWDSHQAAPGLADAAKSASVATHASHVHRQRRMQRRMSDRKQLLAPQTRAVDDSSTAPSTSTTTTADDDDSADEEVLSRGIVVYGQDTESFQMHVTQAGTPFLSDWTEPSRNLLLGANGEDIQEIGQWYFACQLPEKDAESFSSVQNTWVKSIWEMGRDSQSIFAALGAFALHKKTILGQGGARSQYYEQKGQIIKNIVADIQKSPNGPDPATVLAMGVLAYLDIRDDQFEAAGTHLRAVRNFIDMPAMPPQAWLYCAWIDFRQALFTNSEPSLPFYVPVVFREVPQSLRFQQREAFRMGAINASQCPRSPVFTLDMASDLFGKLHALCYCSDVLGPSETPPFGQVYALEYGLRVVQARAKRSEGDVFTSPILLVTSAIQLHVWMAARFYTPQARETHLGLIQVASETIDSFEDMITQWYIAAGMESLLWVLFTLVASLRAHELPQTSNMVKLLYQALRKARINNCDDFEARLKRWPWLANWHPVQIGVVWEMLCARYPDLVPRISRANLPEANPDPTKARHRWFLGGLEFFNSL
jgi:hypothetical protein